MSEILRDTAEIFYHSNRVQIAKEVEKKDGHGITAMATENGMRIGGDEVDEGEIDAGAPSCDRPPGTDPVLSIWMNWGRYL